MFGWLINHIISTLPVWIWTFVAGAGAAAFFLSGFIGKIPFEQAKLVSIISKYAGLVVFTLGVFMCGGAGVTAILKAERAEFAAKIAKSEDQSKDANKQLADALEAKKQANKEIQQAIQNRIQQDAAKMDAKCTVDSVAITDLNDAAKNVKGKK